MSPQLSSPSKKPFSSAQAAWQLGDWLNMRTYRLAKLPNYHKTCWASKRKQWQGHNSPKLNVSTQVLKRALYPTRLKFA
jgi:hypothetical protein